MNEDQNIEQSQEDSKSESQQEEMNENISQEQTIEQPETTNPKSEIQKSEIENMEVHHHPDLHHRKKHWKEYFLEFLMIFLAVTLGFFAESYREYLSDRTKEKEYIQSLVEDLKIDTTQLSSLIKQDDKWEIEIDTLLVYFDSIHNISDNPFNRNMQPLFGFSEFIYTDRTMQQLKSAGGLRLIENMSVSDSIIAYDAQAHVVSQSQEFLDRQLENDFLKKIFDIHKVDEMKRKHIPYFFKNKFTSY